MHVKTIGPPDANIMLVGEAPGKEEHRTGRPFEGKAGKELKRMLNDAGISWHECLVANVAREKPPGNKIGYFYEDKNKTVSKPILKQWIAQLKQEIEFYRPNIVVALGATAMYTLGMEKGIKPIRGYIEECALVPGQKMITTWHPQKINYEWKLRFDAVMDLRKALVNSKTAKMPKDNRTLITGMSYREYVDWLRELAESDDETPLVIDIETPHTDKTPGSHVTILGIATSPDFAVSHSLTQNKKARYSPEKEAELWYWFGQVVLKRKLIMQNGVYDTVVLWHNNNIFCKGFYADPLIAAHILWPEAPRSLAYLSSICLNVPRWKQSAASDPLMYNAADCTNTYGVWNVQETELERLGMMPTFEFEMRQVWPASMLQLRGVEVDQDMKAALLDEIGSLTPRVGELGRLDDEIEQEAGKPINIQSHQQIKDLLYIDMGLPTQYKRRKSVTDEKKPTSDAEALNTLLRNTGNTLLKKILRAKKLVRLRGFVDVKTSPEGRVHTSYNVTGATMQRQKAGLIVDDEDQYKSFGRWSSSKSIILPFGTGNLQNVPYSARKMYRAPSKYEIVSADLIQAEAVVVAHLIHDQRLMTMFKEAYGMSPVERKAAFLDVHLITASTMFRVAIEDVTPAQRQVGKQIRHATNYSAGPKVLANKIGCTMTEARNLLRQFMDTTPQLQLWHQKIQKQLRETKILTNLLGRRHKFLDRWGDDLFRSAYSYIPQSSIGDLLNLGLIRLYENYGEDVDMGLQLHDAVYVWLPLGERQQVIDILRACLTQELETTNYKFTVDIDFSAGPSWGEMEKL